MQIRINGEERDVAQGLTVRQLLDLHKLSPDKVAVELNRRLLRHGAYDTVLQGGDQVEIVTFVGGG
jgi:thiamine biosynthesis protein ThiS